MDAMSYIFESDRRNNYKLGHHSQMNKHCLPGLDVPAVLYVTPKATGWDYPPASYLPMETETEES